MLDDEEVSLHLIKQSRLLLDGRALFSYSTGRTPEDFSSLLL